MTIPKRDKRKRRAEGKAFSAPPADKMVAMPPVVKTPFPFWTHICPFCGQGSLSTICQKCGRLTRLKNRVSTK